MDVDDIVGTIPGWTTAIFYDAQGRPYWRSDGESLAAPHPEDLRDQPMMCFACKQTLKNTPFSKGRKT